MEESCLLWRSGALPAWSEFVPSKVAANTDQNIRYMLQSVTQRHEALSLLMSETRQIAVTTAA